ncbi:flagellar biosynthetic protein FlhB [Alkalithermobacter thermoalcaliphilus JW-YL-7 = DSM 7308]|uniref:Flagellar biosynthetic protein FlhB n=1 Tax=Alkalithermobacter thermoalcaliphilus JW-YL-7 = DSM 7308 TaxID=1121328 RepID=A0A150FQA1_CLOPD|nr:flagellar biosynthetic protein FlhB [[Clostridium] paradoxum JW-YL-7 = DSM 7308]SHK60676.1 flagellar biosynthetic protein FlhB [[Clostridium] paradoxum JW-YL-7 = DSM 7308]
MNIKINLQLFSEEKTEKATPRKRQEARKKGQVLQSREVTTSFTLLLSLVGLKLFGKYVFVSIYESLIFFQKNFMYSNFDTAQGYRIGVYILYYILKGVFIIIFINFIGSFLGAYIQVGNLFTTENLKFKFNRLNPIEGFKRLFSIRSLVEFLKSFLKLVVLGFVSYIYLKRNLNIILNQINLNKFQFSYTLYSLSINLGIILACILILMSFFDYLYQWYEYEKNLKMSKKEIKEEFKQTEGDPQIKSKIKQKQRQMAMSRMMQDVPKADVIITNPTHYAVAIRYDETMYDAPYVVAKGKNLVALKIKEIAKENEIVVIENKPLARELYNSIDIGDLIPPQLYETIAEILAYVYSLKRNK